MNKASLPYRTGVGIILLNPANHVFVAKRIDMKAEAWQMPQGGIDEGETPEKAAMRELGEETGTDKARIIGTNDKWYTYDLPDELVPVIWGGRFRGQKQKWFVLRFLGKDSDINIETDEPEFSEWRWTKPATLPDMIVPFKRELYAELVRDFANYLDCP